MRTYYEFFAGGGMAHAGLGDGWKCLFANDFDAKKAAAYVRNWGGGAMHVGDVAQIGADVLPGRADLSWASFPCQDLSLAGSGAGLAGERSGTFWSYWKLMRELADAGRAPRILTLENVVGAITSHGGRDLESIGRALDVAGYDYGPFVADAADFLPQSRPRLFVIGVHRSLRIPRDLLAGAPDPQWHPKALRLFHASRAAEARPGWRWWRLPPPPGRNTELLSIIESSPVGVEWHDPAHTQRLLDMMAPLHRARVDAARALRRLVVGAIYRRARPDGERARRVQRAEVRFDGLAGCLRTPGGGSSRQTLLFVNGDDVRSRLLSPREAARLMGLPDEYELPSRYNDAYHLLGDGLAVPVVRFIAEELIEPLLNAADEARDIAA